MARVVAFSGMEACKKYSQYIFNFFRLLCESNKLLFLLFGRSCISAGAKSLPLCLVGNRNA